MKTNGMKKVLALLTSGIILAGAMSPLSAFAAENSVEITALEREGGIKVKALLKADGAEITGEAIAAVYKSSNELISVKSSAAEAETSFIFEGLEDAGYVKVMWWDSLTGMKPMAESSVKYLSASEPTSTPEVTATSTPEVTATSTPEVTATSTPEVTATSTPEVTATSTPEVTATSTPEVTATSTPEVTATSTPEVTATSTPEVTATSTPEVTATSTPDVTATSTPDVTATSTPDVTATSTPVVTATSTPEVTATSTPEVTATSTPEVTATSTPEVTTTSTPEVTATSEPTAEPTAEPTNEPEEVTITGYAPIETLVTDYIDKYGSSYSSLPKKVTFNLSDGTSFDVDVWTWSFTDSSQVAAGKTATAKAILDDAPYPYRNTYSDYFDNMNEHPVTMQVTFKEAPPEVSFTYDESHLVGNVATYLYTEDPVLTLVNYTGDGSDISMDLGYDYNYKNLTNGDGLTYNAENNTVTIDSSEIMANGFVSNINKYLKVGSKNLSVYIKYTTDRSVMFEGASEAGSVSYSDVSWKTPFVKDVTFTNVPEADINAITFKCSGYDITDKLTFTKKADNVYTLTVPYDEVKGYLSSYDNSVSITMNVEGMSAPTISITYRKAPSLSLDKSKYYAEQNPVVTLNNFSFENVSKEQLVVSWDDSGSNKTLTKDTEYTLSENSDGKVIITIDSAEALGASTLDDTKTVTLTVSAAADGEEASVEISYKANIAITVEDVTDATPYTTVLAELGGSTEGYSGLKVYHGDTLLENVSVTYNYTIYANVISIPYASVSALLDINNSVTLTAKLTGSADATFTVSYATVSEDGAKLPVDTIGGYSAKADANQDGLPAMAANAEIYVYTTDTTVSNSDWNSSVGVTIKKKDAQDSEQISVGVSYTYSIWDSNYDTVGYKVQLKSLSQYKDDLFDASDEGGAFTLTFYKNGYAKTTLDVYLTNPWKSSN